ncbi:MAG TPA: hypothetical protein VF746_10835 [Longimicrobium sp.]
MLEAGSTLHHVYPAGNVSRVWRAVGRVFLSSNTHDGDVEAAMTAAFVCGPLAALIGFVVGLVRSGRRMPAGQGPER